MERARLALKYFARPLSNSNIGSESLKIRNMCRLLLHYTTPTFIRALILHPRLSALLKAHTFQFLILLFLPIRRHHQGHGPRHSVCPLLHRHPLFLRLSLMIIEHNHQWCLHKYYWIFLLPIAVNAVWESTWVVFGKVSASPRPSKGIPSL
jgi:hypothetical protein